MAEKVSTAAVLITH